MKIYTRTGDEGRTDLPGGERTGKNDPRVEACGAVDELNAALGLLRLSLADSRFDVRREELRTVQTLLFQIGSCLATIAMGNACQPPTETDRENLENAMDEMEAALPPLQGWVLPGANPASAQAHVARTVCRRTERRVVSMLSMPGIHANFLHPILAYLNRLSDYLFMLSRLSETDEG